MQRTCEEHGGRISMKRTLLAVFVLFLSAALSHAQIFMLSGEIRNERGESLEGVAVRLGKAGLKTVTDREGKFTLTGNATRASVPAIRPAAGCEPFRQKVFYPESMEKLSFQVINVERVQSGMDSSSPA